MAITCPHCGRQYDVTLFEFGHTVRCDCGRQVDLSQGHLIEMPVPVEGVLIDIAGVLYVGDEPIDGAARALQRLEQSGLAVRYLTNTTRSTRRRLINRLRHLGFDLDPSTVFTAPIATRRYLRQHRLRPYLLVHPELVEEFAAVDQSEPNAVVVGDAGDRFNYRTLNEAFRVLMRGGQLVAMGMNRFFREQNELSLDMGPFVEALRFASGLQPVIIGKPSADFFQEALDDMRVPASRAVMIGDDLENDVLGAQLCGIRGILVRTGKYRPEDEHHEDDRPDYTANDIREAVDQILAARGRR